MKIKIFHVLTLVCLASCANLKEDKISENVGAAEIVIYQAKEGGSESEAISKAQSVNDFASSQDGFISRIMSETADGNWVDIIFWESLEKAKKAHEKAMQSTAPAAFFEIIDEQTMTFLHAEKVFSLTK